MVGYSALDLVQFRTGMKPDGIKHTVAHTIVLCMHQRPAALYSVSRSVIGPVRNCTSAGYSAIKPQS